MAEVAARRATYEDLLAVPEHLVAKIIDGICEVVSPESTETRDREQKMPIYAREGVSHLLLVNPVAKTLEAYALTQTRWLLLGTWSGDKRVRVAPFDAVELELAALWSR